MEKCTKENNKVSAPEAWEWFELVYFLPVRILNQFISIWIFLFYIVCIKALKSLIRGVV